LLTLDETCCPEKEDGDRAETCNTRSKRVANERVFMAALEEELFHEKLVVVVFVRSGCFISSSVMMFFPVAVDGEFGRQYEW
jgi:hypothetical protein